MLGQLVNYFENLHHYVVPCIKSLSDEILETLCYKKGENTSEYFITKRLFKPKNNQKLQKGELF